MKSAHLVRLFIVLSVLLLIYFRGILLSTIANITQYTLTQTNNTHNSPTNIQLSPISHVCTTQEANLLGEKYVTIYKHIWSACYSDEYLLQFYFADMINDGALLLFDVGANKGYTVATWLSLWFPNLRINPRTLGNYLRTELNNNDCGACGDCKETLFENLTFTKYVKKTINIYAFEPQPNTYQLLQKVQKWMNVSFLHTYELALSNQSGSGFLAKCPPGGESCGLATDSNANKKPNYIQTKITTLDRFLVEHSINQKIDVLKIDAEGFDPLIIQGADNALNQHQIRLLLFEYHGVGMWSATSLYQVVTNLDRKGYMCYQLGQTGIFRLTACWSSKFEIRVWSNVLCVSRRESRLVNYIEKLLIQL